MLAVGIPQPGALDTGSAPSELTHSLIESIDSAQDHVVLVGVEERAREAAAAQAARIEEAKACVRDLAAELSALQAKEALASTREQDRRDHEDRMAALDREKFTIARSISEADEAIARLEAQWADVQGKLTHVQEALARERSAPPDGLELALLMYKSLGMELVADASGEGGDATPIFPSLLVRNAQTGQVEAVELDSEHSRFYYANLLWDMCS